MRPLVLACQAPPGTGKTTLFNNLFEEYSGTFLRGLAGSDGKGLNDLTVHPGVNFIHLDLDGISPSIEQIQHFFRELEQKINNCLFYTGCGPDEIKLVVGWDKNLNSDGLAKLKAATHGLARVECLALQQQGAESKDDDEETLTYFTATTPPEEPVYRRPIELLLLSLLNIQDRSAHPTGVSGKHSKPEASWMDAVTSLVVDSGEWKTAGQNLSLSRKHAYANAPHPVHLYSSPSFASLFSFFDSEQLDDFLAAFRQLVEQKLRAKQFYKAHQKNKNKCKAHKAGLLETSKKLEAGLKALTDKAGVPLKNFLRAYRKTAATHLFACAQHVIASHQQPLAHHVTPERIQISLDKQTIQAIQALSAGHITKKHASKAKTLHVTVHHSSHQALSPYIRDFLIQAAGANATFTPSDIYLDADTLFVIVNHIEVKQKDGSCLTISRNEKAGDYICNIFNAIIKSTSEHAYPGQPHISIANVREYDPANNHTLKKQDTPGAFVFPLQHVSLTGSVDCLAWPAQNLELPEANNAQSTAGSAAAAGEQPKKEKAEDASSLQAGIPLEAKDENDNVIMYCGFPEGRAQFLECMRDTFLSKGAQLTQTPSNGNATVASLFEIQEGATIDVNTIASAYLRFNAPENLDMKEGGTQKIIHLSGPNANADVCFKQNGDNAFYFLPFEAFVKHTRLPPPQKTGRVQELEASRARLLSTNTKKKGKESEAEAAQARLMADLKRGSQPVKMHEAIESLEEQLAWEQQKSTLLYLLHSDKKPTLEMMIDLPVPTLVQYQGTQKTKKGEQQVITYTLYGASKAKKGERCLTLIPPNEMNAEHKKSEFAFPRIAGKEPTLIIVTPEGINSALWEIVGRGSDKSTVKRPEKIAPVGAASKKNKGNKKKGGKTKKGSAQTNPPAGGPPVVAAGPAAVSKPVEPGIAAAAAHVQAQPSP